MQTIEFPSLADHALPAGSAARERQLRRFVDSYASAEAAAALKAAAERMRGESGILPRALLAADAVLSGKADDPAAGDRLRDAVTSAEFLALLPRLVRELREIASARPETGACTIATAMKLWSWTTKHFLGRGTDVGATDELAEAICPLLAARCLVMDLAGNQTRSFAAHASDASAIQDEIVARDLCHVYAARTAAAAGSVCAELVFGYRRHLSWDAEGCATCYGGDQLDDLEAVMPGIASGARMSTDVIEADGSHPVKEGPCARFEGVDTFMRLRNRLDACLTGARIARDRAAAAIAVSTTATTSKGKAS